MRRRNFLKGMAASVAGSSTAHAQRGVPVVGYLNAGAPDTNPTYLPTFREGLADTGFIEGQNFTIEYRWAENHFDRLPSLAADLIQRQVSVIAATGGPPAVVAAKNATTTIPIVFTSGADPVKSGLVASLGRPGGNITGMSLFYAELGDKRLGLLRELMKKADLIAFIVNPKFSEGQAQLKDVSEAAQRIGQQIKILYASSQNETDAALASFKEQNPDGLLVASDPVFSGFRDTFIKFAADHTIPAMYYDRAFVEQGGLMSYGTDVKEMYRQAGIYAARILKGEKPGDLPVIQPSKFELTINLKTAKAQGINVPYCRRRAGGKLGAARRPAVQDQLLAWRFTPSLCEARQTAANDRKQIIEAQSRAGSF
jgi:putative tryptophan/tyrosine transport system substrate-binding protein